MTNKKIKNIKFQNNPLKKNKNINKKSNKKSYK